MDNASVTELRKKELDGVREMREMIKEFLRKGRGSKPIHSFLTNANDDQELLHRFLRGRKYRPKYAWETLKRYAEVRFETYPEVFPETLPKNCFLLRDNFAFGLLKARDSKGRRVGYLNASKWDASSITMEMLTMIAVKFAEQVLNDEDAMNNGVVFIQECGGMTLDHAKHYTLPSILRLINVFWHSYPLKFKGIYYINVPHFLTFLYSFGKPFLPKKLKQRFLLSPVSHQFKELHEKISPDILPKCLGGNLDYDEALDVDFFNVRQ